MVTPEAAGRKRPNVAGVLSERVSNSSFGFQLVEASDVVAVRTAPRLDAAIDDRAAATGGRLRAVRDADGVEIEEVLLTYGQDVDDLVGAGEAVLGIARHGVRLTPDNLVPHDEPVRLQGECEAFRCHDQ